MDRGDDEDFRAFVASRSPALLRTAYLLTGDRHWGRIRAAGNPEAYVRKVLLNERRRPEISRGGSTQTGTVTGGLVTTGDATVVVYDDQHRPLKLVDVRTLPQLPELNR